MDKKKALKEVKALIEEYGSAYVSYKLGYKTSGTVEAWLKRKSVPTWFMNRMDTFISEIKAT